MNGVAVTVRPGVSWISELESESSNLIMIFIDASGDTANLEISVVRTIVEEIFFERSVGSALIRISP